MDYTPQEIMVAAAAREIRDGEIVFTGMRLPLIAFALAKAMHAPSAIGLFECGLVRDTPAPELLYTMGDPPNIAGALWATRMINMMGLLQRGAVDLGFIGGAELDRFGNLNTSYLGNPESPKTKLPGSGGAADIASLAREPFDLVVAISVFEHVRFLEDLLAALPAKLYPGGLLLVGMPRVDRIMKLLFEQVIGYKRINSLHINTFSMFQQYSRKHFKTLKTAHLPARFPNFATLYHAALLQTHPLETG